MVDPIADMLTRIRNAQAVGHTTVKLPYSKIKYELAQILVKAGFLKSVFHQGKKVNKTIELELLYDNKMPKIRGIKMISKQGQRIYKKAADLKPVKQGYGIAVISTSHGLMTNNEAKKQKIGGEVICEVW